MKRCCPACKSKNATPVGEKLNFQFVICSACKSLFTSEPPVDGEEQQYEDYGYSSSNIPSFIDARCDELVKPFEKYRKFNKFLEVGFGAGTVIRAAARARWNVSGVEMSSTAVKVLGDRHPEFDLRCGALESQSFEAESFDGVAIVEVIEHVLDPEPLLSEVFRILRPGGVVWVTTPSLNSLSWRLLGLNWSMVAPPDHLEIYSTKGVRTLLASCGYTVQRLDTFGINPYEILKFYKGKEEVSVGDRLNSGYDLNESLESGGVGKMAKQAVNALLNLAKLGDGIKVWAEKN
jgi:SAM-dependent methyltransferase